MSQVSSHPSAGVPGTADHVGATRMVAKRARHASGTKSNTTPSSAKKTAVGDELFGFQLQQELGHGAFARVFLATQVDLAGRPVVLKVSGPEGDEPQTLAQLQHTHIVPIHSVHEDASKGLRAVCMPYFGGASLASVLHNLRAEARRPMLASELARALQKCGGPAVRPARALVSSAEGACESKPTPSWSNWTYQQAAAWIVARLAEGLHHAHQRGVLHRDIKPSNILITADGQPMLLDFNVSQSEHADPAQNETTVGGTVAYMAPEHLRALSSRDAAHICKVDRGADIYSLGMVLYEMLAGSNPFSQSSTYSPVKTRVAALAEERSRAVPSARQQRSDVAWGLESIVRKCLEPDPHRRYQRADELAEDLRRFLSDQPLRFAPELSRAEQVHKWFRRHPRLTSSGSVATAAVVLLLAVGVTLAGVKKHLETAQRELQHEKAQDIKRQYAAGHVRALCLVNTTNDLPPELRATLEDHLRQGRHVCEETLALYGVLDRDDWQRQPAWKDLAPDEQRELAEDTRELLMLLAWARVRSAGRHQTAPHDALQLLDRASAIAGIEPCRALWEDRARYLHDFGDEEAANAARAKADALKPVGARGFYLLAGSHARQGRYVEAVADLDEALRLNPRHYWSSIQRGICRQELGRYALAAADFGVCVGLWPEFAWGYFNRGCALEKSGFLAEALQDYSAALERDPSFLLAYLNRGLVRLELKQYDAALADFDKAAERGVVDAVLDTGRGVALESLKRHAEADSTFAAAFTRSENAPESVQTRIAWTYAFAVSNRLPDKALAKFDAILRRHPNHPQALYGRAMLLAGKGQAAEAITLFNSAIDVAPQFVEPRRYRAILLARTGQLEAAMRDINWCLQKEPEAGATHYAAACVAALACGQYPDRAAANVAANQGLTFLEKALALGYGRDKAIADPDLNGIRPLPRFDEILQKRGQATALVK